MSALKYWDSGSSTWKIVASATAGLPTGGTASQVLSKIDGTDYNTQWTTLTGGGNVSNVATPTANQLAIWTAATTIKGVTAVTGGTANQVLTKIDATDYNWNWTTPTVYGNVSNSGTPAATQVAVWTDATHIQGATALTAGAGAMTLSYDNGAGSCQIILNSLSASNKRSSILFQSSGVSQWSVLNDFAGGGGLNFSIRDLISSGTPFRLYLNASGLSVPSDNAISWATTTGGGATVDTALMRDSAGVVSVTNNVAGTYRDLLARNVNVTTAVQINGAVTEAIYSNSSVTSQSLSTSDVYVVGGNIVMPAGAFKAGGQYRCIFDVAKTTGTGAIVINVRAGVNASAADVSRTSFTFGAGTSVADTGTFEVVVNLRTIGVSTVISGFCRAQHNLATTGLFNNAAAWTIVGAIPGGYDSSAHVSIGLSFNGGTAFAGTITTVQATLTQ